MDNRVIYAAAAACIVRYATQITFLKVVHERVLRVALRQNASSQQQITNLPCAGVYEANHYRGLMVYK